MHTELIEYSHGDITLQGFFASADTEGPDRPGILICHAWGGRDDFVADRARALAEMGYNAFALDVYGKGVQGDGPEQNSVLMQPLLDDRGLLRDRLLAGLEVLRAQPNTDSDRIAAIGYCFGGLCALDIARSGAAICGAVSIHGLFMPPELPAQDITARILALHGWSDPMVPPEMVVAFGEEMTAAGVDWQLHGYGGVLHAFTTPEANDLNLGVRYDATAARRSWEAMCCFFEEIFD